MTSWILHFFFDPNTGNWRHFPSLGAAIIAGRLAHGAQWEAGRRDPIHIWKAKTVNLTQRTLIDILDGKSWIDTPRKLAFTVGIGGGHDAKWYDTELLNGRDPGRHSRSQEHPSDGMASPS